MPATRASTLPPTTSSSRKARLASHDAPGYSSSNASASGGRAGVAPDVRAPRLRRTGCAASSSLDRDLDAGRSGDTRPAHGLAPLVGCGGCLGLLLRLGAVPG